MLDTILETENLSGLVISVIGVISAALIIGWVVSYLNYKGNRLALTIGLALGLPASIELCWIWPTLGN
ncbi:MAG: hypothetical protein Q8P13_02630 [bacterium]|nr:hypothetical protein [bacterium]